MADPKPTQVVAAVKARLEAITGQYAPEKVVEWEVFTREVLDPSVREVVCLSPDFREDERLTFGTTNNMLVKMPIDLSVCVKFEGAGGPFNPPTPSKWAVQEQAVKAVKDALRSDRTFGALILDSEIPATDFDADSVVADGWAITFLRMTTEFLHSETNA